MSAATGAHTVWVWIWEDVNTYNQDPGTPTDTDFKIFGTNETVEAQDRSNNAERFYRPFDRAADTILEGAFDGSWGTDWVLTNPYWLQFIFGEPTVNEPSTGTFEWTFSLDPRNAPRSAHLIEEIHYPDDTIEQTVYTGVIASSVDIDVSVEDTVSCSLSGAYATEESVSTADGDQMIYGDTEMGINEQPATEFRPMHFGNSYLRMDLDEDGTAEAKSLVQDTSLSMEGNAELQNELGTRFAAATSFLQFEPDLSYTSLVGLGVKDEERRNAYGESAASSPQETMENAALAGELEFFSGIGTSEPQIVMDLQGAFPDEFDRGNVGDPQEVLEDNVDRMLEDVVVTVTVDSEPK